MSAGRPSPMSSNEPGPLSLWGCKCCRISPNVADYVRICLVDNKGKHGAGIKSLPSKEMVGSISS